jgi:UDP-glucose 4-epimerase
MKKAIVTGGAGFIGRHLVDHLTENGWNVLVVDDFSTHKNHNDAVLPIRERFGKQCTWYQIGSVQEVIFPEMFRDDVDAIFHLAGKLGPVGVIKYKGYIALDTITAADEVSWWADRLDCPLIMTSTSEIYGSPDAANSETTPKVFREFSARSEYAVSKLASENMLFNRNIDARVVRPFNVTGPGQRPEGGFVLPRFVRQALDNDYLTVYAPGTQQRSFTHVKDIVDGIMLVYENGNSKESYNIGNPNNTRTIEWIANEVVRQTGHGAVSIVDPTTLHGKDFKEAPDKIPDITKVRGLGYNPTIPIEQIIEDVIADVKSASLRVPDTEQA